MTTLQIETPRVFLPLLQPARYLGIYGGRGSGKSHFFADLWLEESISKKLDYVMVRETQKSLEFSVKKLLESKVRSNNAGYYFEIQDKKITSSRGGITIFEGMQNHTADSIKSLEDFDRAWFEEAHKASDKSLTLLRPTIRKPGSQIWASWNPENKTDPIDLLLRGDEPPPNSIVVQANFSDNPWFPKELRDEMEYDQKRDRDKYNWVWLGGYRSVSDAIVFKNWTIEEFDEPKPGTVFRMGADWGFATDPSVLVRCWIDGRRLYVDYEAYAVGCEIDFLPDLFANVPESGKWPIIADSARPETISYMQRHGYPKITRAIKGPKSLEEGVEFLKSYDIVVHPRCKHVIQELASYSCKVDEHTQEVLPILADKDNHTIDALRYACEGLRRSGNISKVTRRSISIPTGKAAWMT